MPQFLPDFRRKQDFGLFNYPLYRLFSPQAARSGGVNHGLSKLSEQLSGWTPKQLSNLQVWLDASKETGYSDDEALSILEDNSGNGYNFTGVNGPRWRDKNNGISGKPAYKFVASSSMGAHSDNSTLTSLFSGNDEPLTVLAVLKLADTSGIYAWWGLGNSASGTQFHNIRSNPSPAWASFRRDDASAGAENAGGTAGTSAAIASYFYTGSSETMRINGSAVIDAASVSTGVLTLNRMSVGYVLRSSGSTYFNGLISEIVVCSGAITLSEIQQYESYAASKYSITLAA